MCVVLAKLSLLFVSVTWCLAAEQPAAGRMLDVPAGIHVYITAQAIEISFRLQRRAAAGCDCSSQL